MNENISCKNCRLFITKCNIKKQGNNIVCDAGMQRDDYSDFLWCKCDTELKKYKEALSMCSPKVIIENAYRICIYEELVGIFEFDDENNEVIAKKILELFPVNILENLYQLWIEDDTISSISSDLRNMIKENMSMSYIKC